MTLIVCVDQRNGFRFNNRRQSSDRCVTERINYLLADGKNTCFLENGDPFTYLKSVEKLIVFRWDKVYPADTKFPMEDFLKQLTLQSRETFPGFSHELITQEVYIR